MNFTDGDGLDLTYYDIDFLGGLSEKNNKPFNKWWEDYHWLMLLYISNNILLCLIFTYDLLLLFTLCLVLLVISKIHVLFGLKINEDDEYLIDCVTTHTILRDKRYFVKLTLIKTNVSTISSTMNLI